MFSILSKITSLVKKIILLIKLWLLRLSLPSLPDFPDLPSLGSLSKMAQLSQMSSLSSISDLSQSTLAKASLENLVPIAAGGVGKTIISKKNKKRNGCGEVSIDKRYTITNFKITTSINGDFYIVAWAQVPKALSVNTIGAVANFTLISGKNKISLKSVVWSSRWQDGIAEIVCCQLNRLNYESYSFAWINAELKKVMQDILSSTSLKLICNQRVKGSVYTFNKTLMCSMRYVLFMFGLGFFISKDGEMETFETLRAVKTNSVKEEEVQIKSVTLLPSVSHVVEESYSPSQPKQMSRRQERNSFTEKDKYGIGSHIFNPIMNESKSIIGSLAGPLVNCSSVKWDIFAGEKVKISRGEFIVAESISTPVGSDLKLIDPGSNLLMPNPNMSMQNVFSCTVIGGADKRKVAANGSIECYFNWDKNKTKFLARSIQPVTGKKIQEYSFPVGGSEVCVVIPNGNLSEALVVGGVFNANSKLSLKTTKKGSMIKRGTKTMLWEDKGAAIFDGTKLSAKFKQVQINSTGFKVTARSMGLKAKMSKISAIKGGINMKICNIKSKIASFKGGLKCSISSGVMSLKAGSLNTRSGATSITTGALTLQSGAASLTTGAVNMVSGSVSITGASFTVLAPSIDMNGLLKTNTRIVMIVP